MDRCERIEADASACAFDRGMRFGAVCKVLYSKLGAAYWQAIVLTPRLSFALVSDPAHSARFFYIELGSADWQAIVGMPRSLALGSDPAPSAIFFTASVDQ